MTERASCLQLEGETQTGLESEFIKVVPPNERGAGFNRNESIFSETLSDQKIQPEEPFPAIEKIHGDILRRKKSYKPVAR